MVDISIFTWYLHVYHHLYILLNVVNLFTHGVNFGLICCYAVVKSLLKYFIVFYRDLKCCYIVNLLHECHAVFKMLFMLLKCYVFISFVDSVACC